MEKELKIEVPQGYEINRQKSTFEKIVFKKIEHCKPTTWEEYCKYAKDFPSYCGNPLQNNICETRFDGFYNEFFTEERVKQYVSLGKLLQLRDYWVKGYSEFRYAVYVDRLDGTEICDWCENTNHPLTFPTREMAKEFKDCFSELIKQAFPLV